MIKFYSLYSEQLVPTPILKSVPSQISPIVHKITNTWHALQNNSCPKLPQKGETKRKLHQLRHKSFLVFPTHAHKVRKHGTLHRGQFQLVQSTVNEFYQRDRKESNRREVCKSYGTFQFQYWYYLNLIVLFISLSYSWSHQVL